MDILTIMIVMFLTYFVLSITANRIALAVFCLVTLYFGIMILMGNITLGNTVIVASGSNERYLLFLIMTFGSIMGIASSVTESRRGDHQ